MKREVRFSADCLGMDWTQERARAVLDLFPDEWDIAVASTACAPKFDPCERHLDLQQPPEPDECDQCESYDLAYVGPGWQFYCGDKYVGVVASFELMEDETWRNRYLDKVRYAFQRDAQMQEAARG